MASTLEQIRVLTRNFNSMLLEWEEVEFNSNVTYTVQVSSPGGTFDRLTSVPRISLDSLIPETLYQIVVSNNALADLLSVGNVTTCELFTQGDMSRDPGTGACVAMPGYFLDVDGLAQSCVEVGEGINQESCSNQGLTVQSLELTTGFWRASLVTTEITRCPVEEFCSPVVDFGLDNASGTNIYCSPDHIGTFCSQCDEDFIRVGLTCQSCDGVDDTEAYRGLIVASLALVLLAVFFSGYILSYTDGVFCSACSSTGGNSKGPEHDGDDGSLMEDGAANAPQEEQDFAPGEPSVLAKILASVAVKIRIAIGFFQVLLIYESSFQRQTHSEAFEVVLIALSFVCNLDFLPIFDYLGFRCVLDYAFYDELVFVTAFPPVLILVLLLMTGCFLLVMSDSRNTLGLGFIACLLVILFLVYPFVSSVIFKTFVCEDFPEAEGVDNFLSALRADFTVDCDAEDREDWLIYAGVMCSVYPLGIVCMYALATIFYRPSPGLDTQPLAFLFAPYNSSSYWYETYELVRKLLMTSLIILLQLIPSSFLSEILLLSAQNLNILGIIFLVYFKPYKDRSDFWFALLSLILLIPTIQYSFIDPFGDTLSDVVEVITYLELSLMVLFVPLGLCLKAIPGGNLSRREANEIRNRMNDEPSDNQYQIGMRSPRAQSNVVNQKELVKYRTENETLKSDLRLLKAAKSSPALEQEVRVYKMESEITKKEAALNQSEVELLSEELAMAEREKESAKRRLKMLEMMNESLTKDLKLSESEKEVQAEELKYVEEENAQLRAQVDGEEVTVAVDNEDSDEDTDDDESDDDSSEDEKK